MLPGSAAVAADPSSTPAANAHANLHREIVIQLPQRSLAPSTTIMSVPARYAATSTLTEITAVRPDFGTAVTRFAFTPLAEPGIAILL